MVLGADGKVREAKITGPMCYESCQIYMQALEREVETPVQHGGAGSQGHALVKQKGEYPAKPPISRRQSVAWLDSVRILVDKYIVLLGWKLSGAPIAWPACLCEAKRDSTTYRTFLVIGSYADCS